MSAPVVARHAFAVFGESCRVVKVLALGRIRVEVVVEVYCVDIVAAHYVFYNFSYELAVFRQAGIEIQLAVVAHEALGVLVVYVSFR